MLHARRTVSPSPVGPLSTAELLNPDPRWVRLEMLRLLSEFGHSLNLVEDLRPAFVILADVLLLSLAASCNIAPQAPNHLPRVGIRVASIPNFHRVVADAMPSEIAANAFADLCTIIMVDAARHLELVDLALSVPLLRMAAYVGALRYLAHDPDLRPRHLLRLHDAVTCKLTGADFAQGVHTLRHLTDDLTSTVGGPIPFQSCHFGGMSGATSEAGILRSLSASSEVDAATIRRLTASLKRLQARQEVLRQASDTSSREAVETSNQIGFLFRHIAFLKRCYRRSGGGAA